MPLLNQSLPKSAPRHKRLHLAVSAITTCSRKLSDATWLQAAKHLKAPFERPWDAPKGLFSSQKRMH